MGSVNFSMNNNFWFLVFTIKAIRLSLDLFKKLRVLLMSNEVSCSYEIKESFECIGRKMNP